MMASAASNVSVADQWGQWVKAKRTIKREAGDLISSEEVEKLTLRHMQLPKKRSRKSLEDDDEGDDICLQMKMLRGNPESFPVAGGYLAPPMLRRAVRPTHDMTVTLQPPSLQRGVSTLDSSSMHSIKSTSSLPPALGEIKPARSGAALSA